VNFDSISPPERIEVSIIDSSSDLVGKLSPRLILSAIDSIPAFMVDVVLANPDIAPPIKAPT